MAELADQSATVPVLLPQQLRAVVHMAVERQADVIVLGVPFRRPFGEFELGKVASHVLKSAHCEVILLRMPIS